MMEGPQDDRQYQLWLRHRRGMDAPDGFAERVMDAVQRQPRQTVGQRLWWYLSLQDLLLRAAHSRPGKLVLCGLAFLLGISPFVYLALLAQLIAVSSAAGWGP